MNWLTLIWAVGMGACLTLGLMHLSIWCRTTRAWAQLSYVIATLGIMCMAASEMGIIKAQTPEGFAGAARLAHVATGLFTFGCVAFVHHYFKTDRPWLMFTALGARLLAVLLNFTTGSSLHFRSVESIQQSTFWGEQVTLVDQAVLNPWMPFGPLASFLFMVYVADTSIRHFRHGPPESRRRALVVGGALVLFVCLASVQVALVALQVLRAPFLFSLPFMAMVMAMGYELSHEVLRAARTAQELRQYQERLTLAASSARLVLWEWDIRADRIWLSETGRAIFASGLQTGCTIQQFEDMLHPEDRPHVHAALQSAIHSTDPYASEYRMLRPDGAARWLAASGRVERDAQGRATLLRGVAIDVTARKEAEDAVRDSETRFRNMADNAPVMIWMADTEKHCTFVNKGWLDFTSRTPEQEMGHGWLDNVHPSDLDRCQQAFATAFEKREPFLMEYRLRRHDGQYRWLLDNGVPRFATEGQFLGYIGSALDVSALKLAEAETSRQRHELAHLSRVATLGELSGSLAHELNQPLAIVLSNAQAAQRLLAQPQPDLAEVREILNDIVSEDRRAGEVIKRLRALLKHGEANLQPLSLEQVTGEVLALMRSDLIDRGVAVERAFDRGMPAVSGDSVQLQQVLLNLMLNACDAMAHNAPHERPLRVAVQQVHGFVRLSVQDRGCGLPEGETERIFDPFFTTKREGLGMGLAICRSIATAHGGRLTAETRTPSGTTFHLELPALDTHDES
ncbi:PAS domain-containing protein [Verrucomicrobium sp. BvORR034]|uniref:PAS domain-containing protein n=1 Tax=Verrucomicrobium sp. BvORR034 TaxID=1396418 RepID=UPI00067999E7|nr:PAS domain-containing protein [Verrucomicrobium sp. BvORR034]